MASATCLLVTTPKRTTPRKSAPTQQKLRAEEWRLSVLSMFTYSSFDNVIGIHVSSIIGHHMGLLFESNFTPKMIKNLQNNYKGLVKSFDLYKKEET